MLSKEFTEWDGDFLKTAGFFPWGGPGSFYDQAVEFVIWANTNGGSVFDAGSLKYTIDADPNIQMMEYALEWFDEEYKGDLIAVNTSNSWSVYGDGERAPAWGQGIYAIQNNGYWIATDMYDVSEMQFNNWKLAKYPIGPGGSKHASGYWPNWVVIPKGVPHPQESFDYLDYMVVEGMKVWFGIVPDLPANKKFPKDFVPPTLIGTSSMMPWPCGFPPLRTSTLISFLWHSNRFSTRQPPPKKRSGLFRRLVKKS
jgi:ABC-type glycerol-3-phosphate transport system substrate-binding protein